jgi:hypothetical protein
MADLTGREPTMVQRENTFSRRIQSFVDSPITNLVKGLALLLIGLSDASHTFREDLSHGTVRVGHGLIIIGLFSILGALPHLIESLEAYGRFLELRGEKGKTKNGAGNP